VQLIDALTAHAEALAQQRLEVELQFLEGGLQRGQLREQ
jgi:hypothetical protein